MLSARCSPRHASVREPGRSGVSIQHFSLCGLDLALRAEMTGLMMLSRAVQDIPVRRFRIGAAFSPRSVLTSFKDKIALKGSLRSGWCGALKWCS